MSKQGLINRVKSFGVKHSGKIVAGTAVAATAVQNAAAMSAESIANGSALLTAGIGVAATEPLGSIISMVGVVFGLTAFIKGVKRFT